MEEALFDHIFRPFKFFCSICMASADNISLTTLHLATISLVLQIVTFIEVTGKNAIFSFYFLENIDMCQSDSEVYIYARPSFRKSGQKNPVLDKIAR